MSNPRGWPHRAGVTAVMIGVLAAGLGAPAVAQQDVRVSASLDEHRVALGEPVQLRVTIEGTQDSTPPEPQLDGFVVQYQGPSTYVSVVNGQVSSSVTYVYALLPQRTGTFTIPPISVRAGSQMLQTQPLTVEVVAVPTRSAAGALGALEQEAEDVHTMLRDALDLQLGVDKTRAYVNEAIPARLQLLVDGVSVRSLESPTIQADGFLVQPIGQPKQSNVVVDGRSQTLVEFETLVIPLRPGTLTLGPASVPCQVITRNRPSRRSSALGPDAVEDAFGDTLFDEFFGRAQVFSVIVHAKPVALQVLPLPEEGRPTGFQGAVGHFTLEASAVPAGVAVGEPVTLTMTLRGEGNFNTVTPPQLMGDLTKFKVYEPQLRKDANPDMQSSVRVFEQVLIPIDPSLTQLPALQWISFNPQTGGYDVLTHPPIPLAVRPSAAPAPATIVGPSPSPSTTASPEVLGRDIVYIKERLDGLWRSAAPWYRSWWWLGPWVLALCAWAVVEWLRAGRERLAANPAAVRASGALKRALLHCQVARRLRHDGKPIEAYAQLARAMQRYIGERWNVPWEGITPVEAERELRSRRAPEAVAQRIGELLRRCDAARFAPMSVAQDQLEGAIRDTEAIVQQLERGKPA